MGAEPSLEELVAARERALTDPVWWIEEVLQVKLQPHQKRLIWRIYRSEKRKICIASCNSAAKSHTLACFALWWIYNHAGSKVLTTAPVKSVLEQVLWAEMRKLISTAKIDLGGNLLPRALLLEIDPEWYMVGLNASIPEAFQGRKSLKLLIIVDEASGVRDSTFEALLGNLASGEAVFVLASNPTRATGQVFRAFHSGSAAWDTEQIDAFDTPNFAGLKDEFDCPGTTLDRKLQMLKEAPILVPYLVSPRWAASVLEEFGEESDVWRVRVRGLFPKGDPNQLISLGDFVDANNRWRDIDAMTDEQAAKAAKAGKPFPWWRYRELLSDRVQGGLDPARYGAASSVLGAQARLVSMPQIVYGPQSTTNLTGLVAMDIERFEIHETLVDESGLGGGPCDGLPGWASGILPFNGAWAAFDSKNFTNLRSEQFWHLRLLFQRGQIAVPPCDLAQGQLTSVRYGFCNRTNRKRVETKDELEGRGIRRFDQADAHMMSYAQVPSVEHLRTGAQSLKVVDY